MVRLTVEQVGVEVGDVHRNRESVRTLAERALASGSQVVVFPELAVSGYTTDPDLVRTVAEPLDGPTVGMLTELTARLGGLVATGVCERDGDTFFNTVVVVGPDGPVLHYRKLHLFDAEKNVYAPGDLGLPVVDTDWGRLGVCVCYDLRFVEVLRALSLQGADLVLAPAAWVGGFDRSVPATGLPRQAQAAVVQANLDQVAVAAVSQAPVPGGPASRSPWASTTTEPPSNAGPLSRDSADTATVEIDIAAGRAARLRSERIRPREDRRTDVYGIHYEGNVL
jgi:N-carbamoylputrescine amidase